MTKKSEASSTSGREERARRSARRRQKVIQARQAAARMARPSPLPPHPEGLRPSLWAPLASLAALITLLAGAARSSLGLMLVGAVALGLVILYARMTRDDPKRQLLYAYILGRRQFMNGDYMAALANFRDMEDTDFSPPSVLRGIGLSSYQLGLWVDAVTYLEDVPDRTPEEDSVLAQSLAELGEYEEALKALPAMAGEPLTSRVVRAMLLAREGQVAEAAESLRAIIDEAGGSEAPAEEPYLGARYWLAVALGKTGDQAEAQAVLEELYELAPSYQDVAERLGRQRPSGEADGPSGEADDRGGRPEKD